MPFWGVCFDPFLHRLETESYRKSKKMLAALHPSGMTSGRAALSNILASSPNPKEPQAAESICLPSFSEIISPTASSAKTILPHLPPPPTAEMGFSAPQQFVCLHPQHPQLMNTFNNPPFIQQPINQTAYPVPRFQQMPYQYFVTQQAAPHMTEGNSLSFLATMADQTALRHPNQPIYSKQDQAFQFHQQKIPNSPISDQPIEYPCMHVGCRKVFPSRSRLHRHEIVHLGEKNFKCIHSGCEKRFSRKDNMLQHYRNHGVSFARDSSKKGRPSSKTDEH